jgi:hypothetical protein
MPQAYNQKDITVQLFGFDIFIARPGINKGTRALLRLEQGSTVDDWEIDVGPWEVIASRIHNRQVAEA